MTRSAGILGYSYVTECARGKLHCVEYSLVGACNEISFGTVRLFVYSAYFWKWTNASFRGKLYTPFALWIYVRSDPKSLLPKLKNSLKALHFASER